MPRLDELLARNLGISKTAVARLVAEGRVRAASGEVLHDRKAATSGVDGEPAKVTVDDQSVALFESALVLQHKPVGVVTALRDARHPTAYALLEDAPLFSDLRPVGRLDLDTSGLLLWTTEGALIQRLTHPKRRVPRTYQAILAGPFRPPPADFVLDDGYRPEVIDLRELAAAEVHPALVIPGVDAASLPPAGATWASLTIIGGAYHEVRRVFAALGSHVLGLCRTHFGDYALPIDLRAGDWRRLPEPVGS